MKARVLKPKAVRQEEIVKAVLYIIGNHGITSLTTSALAKEVGLSSGGLFRHFRSREEILTATVEYAVVQVEATFPSESLPPLERVLTLARNRVRLLSSDSGLSWLLRSDQAYLTLPEDGVKTLGRLVSRSREFLLRAIREGVEEGSIRRDISPEVLLVPVMGTIHVLIGMSGVHQEIGSSVEPVLSGLVSLLKPSKNPSKEETKS